MYMIMRAVQILALVVFLRGSANDNAHNLVGNGAPILVWGSFAVMIIAAYLGAKERQKSGAVTKEQTMAENKRSIILMAVIVIAVILMRIL